MRLSTPLIEAMPEEKSGEQGLSMLAVGCGQLGPTGDAWLIYLPIVPSNDVLAWKVKGIMELIGLPARTDASQIVETHRTAFLLSPVHIPLRWTKHHSSANNEGSVAAVAAVAAVYV